MPRFLALVLTVIVKTKEKHKIFSEGLWDVPEGYLMKHLDFYLKLRGQVWSSNKNLGPINLE